MKEELKELYLEDIGAAYSAFLNIYCSLYNKHCPLVLCEQKRNENSKPRTTKGLEIACKKKNKLYREHIKYRTRAADTRYKMYNNNLLSIMRSG